MSLEVIPTTDLLSAYLVGDTTQDERTAVERWLAADLNARGLLEELREMYILLKAGDYQITSTMIDTLRRMIHTKIEELRIKGLLTASVTGDLTPVESSEVRAYLNAIPSAMAAQRQIVAASLLLGSGQRMATSFQSEKLRQRLASALPAGALAPKVATPQPVDAVKTNSPIDIVSPASAAIASQSAPLVERPSLRVFVAPENPWKKRVWALGSIAALVAISVGTRSMMNRGTDIAKIGKVNATVQADSPKPEPTVVVPVENPQNSIIVKIDPASGSVAPRNITPNAIPFTPDIIVKEIPVAPPKAPVDEPGVVAPVLAPKIARSKEDAVETPNVPKATENATAKKENSTTQDPTAPSRNPVTNKLPDGASVARSTQTNSNPNVDPTIGFPIIGTPGATTPGATSTGVASGGGGLPILPPNPPGTIIGPIGPVKTAPILAPTNGGTTIPPQDGAGVTGVVKGAGTVQVNGPDGIVTTLKNTGDTVASGSTIVTDDARVSLVLPGNGRLYIGRFSNLKVSFSKSNTTVELNGGEVYYIAPTGGSLTLNAVKATASKISEGDVSLTAGKLTALDVSDFPLTLTAKKQNTLSVAAGYQASVAVDGSTPVKKDPATTLDGLWRKDVLVPGDGIKAVKNRK